MYIYITHASFLQFDGVETVTGIMLSVLLKSLNRPSTDLPRLMFKCGIIAIIFEYTKHISIYFLEENKLKLVWGKA